MIDVVILGSGNVAQHLIKAFLKTDTINVKQVFARNLNDLSAIIDLKKTTNSYTQITTADLYIVAVSDQAIANVIAQLPFKNQLVVHTSGTTNLFEIPDKNRKGVWYPLQTFSKQKTIDFSNIPIAIEAQNENDYLLLETIAYAVTQKVYRIDYKQRKALHLAAVLVSNFVNHLYHLGNTICTDNNIPFQILYPLIQETAQKITTIAPINAQTGPAIRKDTDTINLHLEFINNDLTKQIYKTITQSIINHAQKL